MCETEDIHRYYYKPRWRIHRVTWSEWVGYISDIRALKARISQVIGYQVIHHEGNSVSYLSLSESVTVVAASRSESDDSKVPPAWLNDGGHLSTLSFPFRRMFRFFPPEALDEDMKRTNWNTGLRQTKMNQLVKPAIGEFVFTFFWLIYIRFTFCSNESRYSRIRLILQSLDLQLITSRFAIVILFF